MRKLHLSLADYPQLRECGGTLHLIEEGVLLARGKKKLRAFSHVCPHKPKNSVSLDGSSKKSCFRCSAHNWAWDRKGRPHGKAERPLKQLRTETCNDVVTVYED